MSNQEIRKGFNQMIQAALAAGDHDAVARFEVARAVAAMKRSAAYSSFWSDADLAILARAVLEST